MRTQSLCAALFALSCSTPPPEENEPARWRPLGVEQPEALLSVSTAGDVVWVVGADRGRGPAVWRLDGGAWELLETGTRGDLWWVQAFDDGSALLGGANATLLRYENGEFERVRTGGLLGQVVFGLWGTSTRDAWAVGGSAGRDGFVWRLRGDHVSHVDLPDDLPRRPDRELPSMLKVCGDSSGVWIVGDRGTLLRGSGDGALRVVPTGTSERLFTVAGGSDDFVAVGGTGTGRILTVGEVPQLVGPEAAPLLQGVAVRGQDAIAVGFGGATFERRSGVWGQVETGVELQVESLHAVALTHRGDAVAVGGNVLSTLDRGVVMVRSVDPWPTLPLRPPPQTGPTQCPEADVDPFPDATMPRRWNEQALAAIRRDLPRPTVHARNLFHLSGAMYDVWAATDAVASGMVVREKRQVGAELDLAIAGAAFEVLSARYANAVGNAATTACLRAQALAVGFDPAVEPPVGSALAFGRSVGRAWLTTFANDGSNEQDNYKDTTGYMSPNPALVTDEPGAEMNDPAAWQPLNLSVAVAQNGLILASGVQGYIGAQWGGVTPFALTRASPSVPWVDPGPGPVFDAALVDDVVTVLRRTAELDPADDTMFDQSPGAQGNNPLGENSGTGHPMNPVTGAPYSPAPIRRSDFGRVLAEYWADGPHSETPPGHWNVLYHRARAHPAFKLELDGVAHEPRALDVKFMFALNGALHDAAIVAWDLKRRYQSSRPISLVRFMATRGQRTETVATDFDAAGLPLVPGLIERITPQTVARGQRHEHLRFFVGELAVKSWRGQPGDPRDTPGVGWIRAKEWMPYQRRSFVTPAFPGYTSGHSTFSRSAAEVLTALTGSAFFPGGLGTTSVSALIHEADPTQPVTLQWATWFDAADQAGQSRVWGGIHVPADDRGGRRAGQRIGLLAVERARAFFRGTP
ncbi:MAG: vanadium-dependent haloperoxidase [Myxococcaceae bacterium]|nr:vanadium-dependent haloperoxidase [Myxococcaceae bacterium]